MQRNVAGSLLTCSNPDCDCRLRIDEPCPHGDRYTCACGHPLVLGDLPLADTPA